MAIDRPQAAISKREKARPKVRYFRLRKRFKEKAGTAAQGETLEMAGDFLARAEAELEKLAEDYPDWVQDYIEQLYAAHGAAVSQVPEERAPEFRRIQELAHEMRGQGGTFGYPLITTFGKSLHMFTGRKAGRTDSHLVIVKAHIDAMNAVISGRVQGDGGETGRLLERALEEAIAKYSPATTGARARKAS